MRIKEIREKSVPLGSTFRNSSMSLSEMTTSVVAVVTDVVRNGKPVVGYAFNSTGRYACGAQMRDRLIPRLARAPEEAVTLDPTAFDPRALVAAMMQGEKPGGDMERSIGIGTIEIAIWDAVAKIAGVPAYQLIADKYNGGTVAQKAFCYVGGGWYSPDKGLQELEDECRTYLDMGYTLLKIKVGGVSLDEDLRRLDRILGLLGGDAQRLAVDANCGIPPQLRPAYIERLKPLKLRWFEEPAAPVDYEGNAEFVRAYQEPVATGENLFSRLDLLNLLRYGGMRPGVDILQADIPQTYGIDYFAQSLDMVRENGWHSHAVLPHGGNQMSLNVCAALDLGMCEAYPNTFGVFSGYADQLKLDQGFLRLGDWEGFGFEGQRQLFELMKSVA
jgi:L-alanine-DL-glutamate epimerase-like enolase superfamily enzyme